MRQLLKMSFAVLLSSNAFAASYPPTEGGYGNNGHEYPGEFPSHPSFPGRDGTYARWSQVAMSLQASVARLNDIVQRASGGYGGEVLERDALAGPYIKMNVTPRIIDGANLSFQAVNAAQIGDFTSANSLRLSACTAIQQGMIYAEQARGTIALIPVGFITPEFISNEIVVYNDSRIGLGC